MDLCLNMSNNRLWHRLKNTTLDTLYKESLRHWELDACPLENYSVSRIYFGTEFCQRLLPSPEVIRNRYEIVKQHRVPFTFLTPYVTDDGISRVRKSLDSLSMLTDSEEDGVEVVVNDWGVLSLIRRDYSGLTPVLGRILSKITKDPRIDFQNHEQFRHSLNVYQKTNITIAAVRHMLRRFGVERVEIDMPDQRLQMDADGLGIELSIHLGLNYVMTGRICMLGSLNASAGEKFKPARECQRECQKYRAFAENPLLRGRVYHQGNTVFFATPWHSDLVEYVQSLGVSRIIFAPDIPV